MNKLQTIVSEKVYEVVKNKYVPLYGSESKAVNALLIFALEKKGDL